MVSKKRQVLTSSSILFVSSIIHASSVSRCKANSLSLFGLSKLNYNVCNTVNSSNRPLRSSGRVARGCFALAPAGPHNCYELVNSFSTPFLLPLVQSSVPTHYLIDILNYNYKFKSLLFKVSLYGVFKNTYSSKDSFILCLI